MIFLHTLGVAVIHVGVRHVLPSASRGFGSLLYLALEPGRAIPRDELQSLLFPKHGRDAGAHSLRQLIYRMRHLGAPIVAHADSVSIPPELVRTDFAQVHEAGNRSPQFLEAAGRGFLPGYSPSFSQPYSDWLDAQRVRIMHDVRRGLLGQLGQFRVLGRWRDLEPIARACLAIDPLNDEATLALAESLALGGQKAGAVQLLDSYLEEIGHYPTQLRTSAHALRTRIHEHVPEPSFRRIGPGPFVGRDEEMAELWRHYHRAKHSEASVVLIYGEPGIGKTRLATEFLKAAALDGATCVKVECAPHDVRRPLGVFVDLVPKLLDAPGGLGVAPEAMAFLQRLTHSPVDAPAPLAQAEPTFLSAFAARAITEAVDAVSAEQTLVLAIDDGHHIDSASATIIGALASHHVARAVLILVTTRHRVGHLLDSCDTLHSLRVRRLLPENALALLERLSSHPSERFDPAQLAQALAFANGNPLFLRSIALQLRQSTSVSPVSHDLVEMIATRAQRLDALATHVLIACALLGPRCTPARMISILECATHRLLRALDDLDDEGLIQIEGGAITSAHPIISEAILSRAAQPTVSVLRVKVADCLQRDAASSHEAALYWAAAEHWIASGDPGKAVVLAIACSRHATMVGHPRTACDILQRVERFCPDSQRCELYSELAGAAHSAEDPALTRSAIDRVREATGDHEAHDDLEFFAIEADRLMGGSVARHISRLGHCLQSHHAGHAHRLYAAHVLLVAFEMMLDAEGARSLFSGIVASGLPLAGRDERARLIRLTYHTFAGDVDQAIETAMEVRQLTAKDAAPNVLRRLYSHAGAALFRCGRCQEAAAAIQDSFALASRYEMRSSALYDAASLAWMHWLLGNAAEHREWQARADDLFECIGVNARSALHLSNKIEFALADARYTEAEQWLERARREYGEIRTPRSAIVERAFVVRLALARGETPTAEQLAELHAMHEAGMAGGLHDVFVEAYWHALAAADRRDEAVVMLKAYIDSWRRDRFPLQPSIAGLVSLT